MVSHILPSLYFSFCGHVEDQMRLMAWTRVDWVCRGYEAGLRSSHKTLYRSLARYGTVECERIWRVR